MPVRAVARGREAYLLSALEEATPVDLGAVGRAALAVHQLAVGVRADDELARLVEVGVLDGHGEVALPNHQRR